MSKLKVKADSYDVSKVNTALSKYPILGTFDGECADSSITNANGLDIVYEVWDNVFNSEEYKKAISYGWYIGFLGHPEDPDCMDFEHACIVMRECHIDPDSGKVYGKFDLIGTPVGYIVKSFIDAGVKFGISVRGAGDIEDNSVDPDTFVFRGFDLVTFPAYPDAVPEFQEIAASNDIESQRKYKKICTAVNSNLNSISSCEALDIIQSQFAKQSDEYKKIEDRKSQIKASTSNTEDIKDQKINALVELYVKSCDDLSKAQLQLENTKRQLSVTASKSIRNMSSMKRILASQIDHINSENKALSRQIKSIQSKNESLKKKVESAERKNLIYKQKIDSSKADIRHKDEIISSLRSDYNETVNAASGLKTRSSNLDEKNKSLRSEIKACRELLTSYQEAYADLYSNALGVDLDHIPITSSTTVSQLKNMISSATNTSNISPVVYPMEDEYLEEDIYDDIEDTDGEIVSL